MMELNIREEEKRLLFEAHNVDLYNEVLDNDPKTCKSKMTIYNLRNDTNYTLKDLDIYIFRGKIFYFHCQFRNSDSFGEDGAIRYKAEFFHYYKLFTDNMLFCTKEDGKFSGIDYKLGNRTIVNINHEDKTFRLGDSFKMVSTNTDTNKSIFTQIIKYKYFKLYGYKSY